MLFDWGSSLTIVAFVRPTIRRIRDFSVHRRKRYWYQNFFYRTTGEPYDRQAHRDVFVTFQLEQSQFWDCDCSQTRTRITILCSRIFLIFLSTILLLLLLQNTDWSDTLKNMLQGRFKKITTVNVPIDNVQLAKRRVKQVKQVYIEQKITNLLLEGTVHGNFYSSNLGSIRPSRQFFGCNAGLQPNHRVALPPRLPKHSSALYTCTYGGRMCECIMWIIYDAASEINSPYRAVVISCCRDLAEQLRWHVGAIIFLEACAVMSQLLGAPRYGAAAAAAVAVWLINRYSCTNKAARCQSKSMRRKHAII